MASLGSHLPPRAKGAGAVAAMVCASSKNWVGKAEELIARRRSAPLTTISLLDIAACAVLSCRSE
jgi:hypothetical protein